MSLTRRAARAIGPTTCLVRDTDNRLHSLVAVRSCRRRPGEPSVKPTSRHPQHSRHELYWVEVSLPVPDFAAAIQLAIVPFGIESPC
jgi:hypothetical protein